MEPRQVLAQLLKGREGKCTVGRMSFTLRRPTEMELIRMRVGDDRQIAVNMQTIQTHTIGWDGVLESDILGPNGASDPVPFDAALFRTWIEDHPELWTPLVEKFAAMVEEHAKRIETLGGN